MKNPLSLEKKFLKGTDFPYKEGCWSWKKCKNSSGYGVVSHGRRPKRKQLYVHRVSYELFNGDIPNHLEIDHLCRNKLCVNPLHLEAVTTKENLRRIPRSTHCPIGHEFSGENLVFTKRGHRICRQCRNHRWRKK